MKVKVPQKIRIISHTYDIKMRRELRVDEGFDGTLNFRTHELCIDPVTLGDQRDQVFWHEILEGLNYALSLKLPHDDLDRIAEGFNYIFQELNINLDWSEIKEG